MTAADHVAIPLTLGQRLHVHRQGDRITLRLALANNGPRLLLVRLTADEAAQLAAALTEHRP